MTGRIAKRLPRRQVVVVVDPGPHRALPLLVDRGQSLEVEEMRREEVGRGAEGDVDRFVVAA